MHHLRVEDNVLADVTFLQLERLDETVDVVVPHSGYQGLVAVDPHASHPGFFPHASLAIEPAHSADPEGRSLWWCVTLFEG